MTKSAGNHFSLIAIIMYMALICTAAHASPAPKIMEIRRPLLSAPVFVKPGGSFEIVLKLGDGVKPGMTSLVSDDDEYSVVALTLTEYGSNSAGAVFKATVPASAPEGLYDLRIKFSNDLSDSQQRSVKLLKEFKKNFDFVHLTDIHFNDQNYPDQDSNLARIKLLFELQKVNPEFIIFSGDLGLNPVTYDRDFTAGYEMIVEYVKSPIFMAPGNHEQYIDKRKVPSIDGRQYWEATYGPYYQSFTYGKLHFIGLNSFDFTDRWRDRYDDTLIMTGAAANGNIGPEQFEWLKNDLQAAAANDYTSIVFTHIPIGFLQGGRKLGFSPPEKIKGPSVAEFSKLMEEYKVPIVFVGHMHESYDDKKLNPVTTEIMTEAAGIGVEGGTDPKWGFRIVHVKDGKIDGSELRRISHKSAQP